MACKGCEVLPRPRTDAGVVYVAAALGHTHQSLRALGGHRGGEIQEPHPGLLGFPVGEGELEAVLAALAERLSGPEMEGCRAVFVPQGTEFGLAQLMDTQPLAALVAQVQAGWLAEMIEQGRLLSFFQPIVSSRAPERVFAYECLLRGRGGEGEMVFPDRLFGVARSAELLFHLDRAARVTAIEESSRHGIEVPIFINFNPTAIYDPAFCLRTTIAAAERSGRAPSQFVFEVVESDSISDVEHLLRILQTYRDAGFRVALDDLGAGYGSLNLLSRLQPEFVKFDRELVRDVHGDPYKEAVLGKLVEMAQAVGTQTIAEGVEVRDEWEWVRDRGVDYVQGYLFARPGTPPPVPQPVGAL